MGSAYTGVIAIIIVTTIAILLIIAAGCACAVILVQVGYFKRHNTAESTPVRKEQIIVMKSLGEAIKTHRTRCQMTQEQVAEALGVSRQAVSKWESGSSDPSTGNLLALARLFGVSAEELLRAVGA